jgi:hypothetical protein
MRRVVFAAGVVLALCGTEVAAADWRTGLDLSPPLETLDGLAVAVGPSGDVVAVWNDDTGPSQISAASSIGAGALSPPVRISGEGGDAISPVVAVNAEGASTAVWENEVAPTDDTEAASRPPGGSFGSVETLMEDTAIYRQVAVDAAGGAVAIFSDGDTFYAAYRAPGGTFSDPDPISGPTSPANPQLAMDPAGNAVVVFQENDSSPDHWSRIAAAFRPTGGTFATATYISDAGSNASRPTVSMNDAGDVAVAWQVGTNLRARYRPAGGSFSSVSFPSDGDANPFNAQITLDNAGNTVVVWEQDDALGENRAWVNTRVRSGQWGQEAPVSATTGDADAIDVAAGAAGQAVVSWEREERVEAIVRQSVGAFSEVRTLSGDGFAVNAPEANMDDAGDALVAWESEGSSDWRLQGAIFDVTAPLVRDVVVPADGTAGVPVAVSAATSDRWSPHTATWAFGDGGTAEGDASSHVYTVPGTYDVVVTATDAAGNATAETRTISIAPAPPPPPPTIGPPLIAVVATVSDLSISPRAFAAASRGASAAQRQRQRRPGGRVTYRLNVAADVRFTVQRRRPGRRARGRCVKPTRRNRARRRCARFVRVPGSFTRASTAGANRFRFTGRLRGRKLRPGRYRLVATPRIGNAAGPVRRTAFRIIRRRR